MMDINDIKKLIDNVVQRPFFCSDTEITTDNGYVITTKERQLLPVAVHKLKAVLENVDQSISFLYT